MSDPVTNNAFAPQMKPSPTNADRANQEVNAGSASQRHLKQEDGLFQQDDEGTKSNAPIVQAQMEPIKKGQAAAAHPQNQGIGLDSGGGTPMGPGPNDTTSQQWNQMQNLQVSDPQGSNNQLPANQMGVRQPNTAQRMGDSPAKQQFASQPQPAGQFKNPQGVQVSAGRNQAMNNRASFAGASGGGSSTPVATRYSGSNSRAAGANQANRNQGRSSALSPSAGGIGPGPAAGGMRPQTTQEMRPQTTQEQHEFTPQYAQQNQNSNQPALVLPLPRASQRQQAPSMRSAPTQAFEQTPQQNPIVPQLEEDEFPQANQFDLVLPDRVVNKLMGPDPIPQIDIEEDEIQNELQKKLVEEIKCAMCGNFPYMPLECKYTHKIYCQYCQIQVMEGPAVDNQADGSQTPKSATLPRAPGPTEARVSKNSADPNVKINNADRFIEVNPITRNLVEFCEFPHRCRRGVPGSEVKWMTINELQHHVQNDECPKFGCDICYIEEYQHLTRRQLREHIKRVCPEVMIQCPICSKEFRRGEFNNHKCLKDFYLQKLRAQRIEIIEYLAQKMMMNRRQKQQLGPCQKLDCLTQFRNTGKHQQENMMVARQNINAVKCVSCNKVHQGQLVYFCMYCQDNYCNDCMAYTSSFDLEELEALLIEVMD